MLIHTYSLSFIHCFSIVEFFFLFGFFWHTLPCLSSVLHSLPSCVHTNSTHLTCSAVSLHSDHLISTTCVLLTPPLSNTPATSCPSFSAFLQVNLQFYSLLNRTVSKILFHLLWFIINSRPRHE